MIQIAKHLFTNMNTEKHCCGVSAYIAIEYPVVSDKAYGWRCCKWSGIPNVYLKKKTLNPD